MTNELPELEKLMRAFDRMHHNCMKGEFQKRALTEASHPSILFMLKHEFPDMSASQVDIARKIGIAPSTVAISLKRMEKAGLVKKTGDKTDLRRNFVTLTEKGQELLSECKNAFRKIDEQIFKGFSREDRRQLAAYYMHMIANLETMGITPPEHFRQNK